MPENESEHYAKAEKWLKQAEDAYALRPASLGHRVDILLRFAAVHAQLATAADVDREATAEARIAGCVPAGGSRFNVAAAGDRR